MTDGTILSEIGSESELVDFLTDGMTAHGWEVAREVQPDSSEYRVDIIATHAEYGRIGLEAKYIDAAGGGGKKIAQAHEQVTRQYWNETYDDEKITLWAICPFFARLVPANQRCSRDRKSTEMYQKMTMEFLRHYGIGHVSVDNRYVLVDFISDSVSEYMVPLFPIEWDIPQSTKNCDTETIREKVAQRREPLDSDEMR